jgi:hypothetical protein
MVLDATVEPLETPWPQTKDGDRRHAMERKNTLPVSKAVFQQVYDSPSSLPGKHRWVTSDDDVRKIETLLGMAPKTIGAPLWVSGDKRNCPKCRRETNWLDIVSSALGKVHAAGMIAQVILGEQRYVNIEAPRAIAGLKCYECNTPIDILRSFKCHNWAYAKPAMLKVLKRIEAGRNKK